MSKDNVTLYNLGVRLRLLGGINPHDELLGRDFRPLGAWVFWEIQAQQTNASLWTPLTPVSDEIGVIGRNETGIFVLRTMTVSSGMFTGILRIIYHTTTNGAVKWDLEFKSQNPGHFKLVYSWLNTSGTPAIRASSKQVAVGYESGNYTFSWNDVSPAFRSATDFRQDRFSLAIDLGTMATGSVVRVDPEVYGGPASTATAYTFQRKVFFEPIGGYYFVFYYDGLSVVYATSPDGVNWVNEQQMPSGWPAYTDDSANEPTVYNIGRTVIVATGQKVQSTFTCPTNPGPPEPCGVATAYLSYITGTITRSNVTWQGLTTIPVSRGCYSTISTCSATAWIRYVSLTLDSTGLPAFSFNFYANSATNGGTTVYDTGSAACRNSDSFPENDVAVVYQGFLWFPECESNDQPLRSTLMPADSQGNVRVIYQAWTGTYQLRTVVITHNAKTIASAGLVADTFISQELPDTVMATDSVGQYRLSLLASTGSAFENDILIKFNLGLPTGAVVTKATLAMTYSNCCGGGWRVDSVNIAAPTYGWSESTASFNTFYRGSFPQVAPFSLFKISNVNFANYTTGKTLSLDVSYAVAMEARGSIDDNGLFLRLDPNSDPNNIPGGHFYSSRNGTAYYPTLSINYECCISSPQVIEPNSDGSDHFSSVVDQNYDVHLVYSGMPNGNTTYAYLAKGSTTWSFSQSIFGATCNPLFCVDSDPTLTVDSSTNDVYALEVANGASGSSLIMKRKTLAQQWTDTSLTTIDSMSSITNLGSNMATISGTNASWVSLVWTGPDAGVWFDSIPIQTAWSPFGSPSDPWDGNGIVPYGTYFQNLGESVSTSNGMLTVEQTYLSMPGRGLDLVLSGVYSEPSSFLNGSPPNYEGYPWAPLGNGWQLSFPWMSNSPTPLYLHLQDGQGYRIPSSFWIGPLATYENHQGENFRLVRTSGYLTLYNSAGISYSFDSAHRLSNITDTNGNIIKISYSGNQISCITDTISRAFTFKYNTNTLLQGISQDTGTCTSPGSPVRTVSFQQTSSNSLSSYTDPLGRITSYAYNANVDSNVTPWFISRITYPTNWYSTYTYTRFSTGTLEYTYRVSSQFTGYGSTPTRIRESDYSYTNTPGGEVNNMTLTQYNGTFAQPVSFTSYLFSYAGVSWNVTDGNHKFVRGEQQVFGVSGEVARDTVLLSDNQGRLSGSYTNYYDYDLWGNLIYSRRIINSNLNWYHESFASYYNDGLQPGFNAFQDTFSQANFTSPEHAWMIHAGTWSVNNGLYNGASLNALSSSWNTFAWTTISKSDISLQARVLIGSQTSNPPFVGVFGHYVSSNTYMWSLVLWDQGSQGQNLVLQDQGNGPLGGSSVPCAIQPNTWYTLNVTFSGLQGTGWAKADGSAACPTVRYAFGPSSFAVHGTGFGLYAGGYSSLFKSVTVSTVSPIMTGAGFSNSFDQNGAPSSTIHDRVAGAGELQNGTSGAPVETYYSYTPQGGLSLKKNRLDSQAGVQWITTSRTYDSFGNLVKAIDARGNSTMFGYSSQYQNGYLTIQNQTLVPSGGLISTSFSYNSTTGMLLSSTDPGGHTARYSYDILGRVKQVTYSNGDFESYSYSDKGNYVNATNENGWLTKQSYDGLGRLSSTQRILNGIAYSAMTYTYNWQGKTSSVKDELGSVTSYQYDPLGRLLRVVEPNGNTTSITYNDFASWIQYTDENGNNRCSVSDRFGRLISLVEEAANNCGSGLVTSYYYDEVGNLLKMFASNYNLVSNPGFETGDFTGWSQTGMIIRSDIVHSGQYSAMGGNYYSPYTLGQNFSQPIPGSKIKLLQIWYIYGVTNRDFADVIYTDGTMDQTALAYAPSWTLVNLTFSASKQIQGLKLVRSSSATGQIVFDDPLVTTSGFTSYKYDSRNRPVQTNYSDFTSEQYTYDSDSNLASRVDRNGSLTSYSYDSVNRVSTIVYHGKTTTTDSYTYDNNGNLLELQSQNATLWYTYDSRNRVTSEAYDVNHAHCVGGPAPPPGYICGGGGSVAAGTMITMANGSTFPVQNLQSGMQVLSYNVTTGQFSRATVIRVAVVQTSNMLVIRTQDPEVLRTDNATIQKLWIKKANGAIGWFSVTQLRVGDYLFKTLDRRWTMVTSIQYIPGSFTMFDVYTSAPYDYLANGYLDPPKLPQGPSQPTPGGIVPQGYSFTYYYSGEQLAATTYNDNMVLNFFYDGLGRVTSLYSAFSITNNVTYARFTYYPNDLVKGIQYGNGLVASYTYDKNSQPSTVKLANGGTSLLGLTYHYAKTGTVLSLIGQIVNTTGTSLPFSESYAYDPLQRLTNATVSYALKNTNIWYEYDALGNRARQSINNAITTYSYNTSNNELVSSTTNSVQTQYGYDNNGDQVSRTGSSQWSYNWNTQGELLSVSNNSVAQGFYAYDGLARRVESKEGSSITFYAYTGTETLAEIIPSMPGNDYVYADGMRIARVNGGQGSNPSITYFHADALGNTRLVTSSSRTVLFSDTYQPFGQDYYSTGSEGYKFTGKPVSTTTGLYYEFQRWYDPSIGRFISADRVAGYRRDPQSLNPYVYVENSPTNNVDPSGLDCLSSLSDFGGCAGNFLYSNTIGAAVSSYNWYQGASDSDRWAFWTGVAVAVGIGVVVGASCVFAACAGLALLGIGLLTGVAGSVWAADAYRFAGGQSEGGLTASLFWGGIGGGLGFGAGGLGADLLTGGEDALVTGEIPGGVRATFEDCGEACLTQDFNGFQYGSAPEYPSHYVTSTRFATSEDAIRGLRLPEYNTASYVRTITIPKGTYVGIGQVRGGTAVQVWVPNLEEILGGPWIPL